MTDLEAALWRLETTVESLDSRLADVERQLLQLEAEFRGLLERVSVVVGGEADA